MYIYIRIHLYFLLYVATIRIIGTTSLRVYVCLCFYVSLHVCVCLCACFANLRKL